MYALTGWFLVLSGTTLALVSVDAAIEGSFAALMPLPFVLIAFKLATHAIRLAAEAIRSVMR
ncbi:MAG: hypothetical protein IT299_04870 [Dehalococcoidia bacterium]|nr:hypothetical protein [Dehalococcoidia bacterium]